MAIVGRCLKSRYVRDLDQSCPDPRKLRNYSGALIYLRAVGADYHMNEPENILAAIYRAIDWMNGELPPDRKLIKARETRLLGSQSVLDSLRLVSLIVTIEREVEDTFAVALTLADERALSMKESPFRSIQSLADYIGILLAEVQNGRE
jgi:acyl carrier protein